MNLITFGIYFIVIIQLVIGKELNCLTGYKILVRRTIQNQDKKKEYKLITKCLCPNNYFGLQCESHVDLDCYLSALNGLGEINQLNVKQQMSYDLEFTAQCWVYPKQKFLGRIELREYLSKYNDSNAFGVREQFGKSEQIVWANTTDIFDSKGELRAISQINSKNSSEVMSANDRLKIMIGNSSRLYEKPFQYSQYFLGFGLVNGNITYRTTLIDPEKGLMNLANYSQTDILVSNVQEYVNSYNNIKQIETQAQSLAKNITELIKNGTINQTIQKYINGTDKPKNLSIIDPKVNVNEQLPKFKVPIKINPFNSTFYSTLRIQLGITEKYQNIATHEISINFLLWTIPVKVDGIGIPVPSSKHLTVTDQGNKSYYKIIAVVIVGGLIFFGLKFFHKKYKLWKNKQYTEFDDDNRIPIQSKTKQKKGQQLHDESIRNISTTQQCQLKGNNDGKFNFRTNISH